VHSRSLSEARGVAKLDEAGMARAADREQSKHDVIARSRGRDGAEGGTDHAQYSAAVKLNGDQLRKYTNLDCIEILECFLRIKGVMDRNQFLKFLTGTKSLPYTTRKNLHRIYSRSNFEQLFTKARDMVMDYYMKQTFDDRIYTAHSKIDSFLDDELYISLEGSKDVFNMLLVTWGVDKMDFLRDMFAILGKLLPKKNTLVLEGPSNSGKSLILRSLLPLYCNIYGEVHPHLSNQFCFMDCVNKPLILAEEFVIVPEIGGSDETLVRRIRVQNLREMSRGCNDPTNSCTHFYESSHNSMASTH
jgi:hypothetical protein